MVFRIIHHTGNTNIIPNQDIQDSVQIQISTSFSTEITTLQRFKYITFLNVTSWVIMQIGAPQFHRQSLKLNVNQQSTNTQQQLQQQPQSQYRPTPVPRNSKPTRRVTFNDKPSSIDDSLLPVTIPINCHEEDDIVTDGVINGIHSKVIVDSGAKISMVCTDFVTSDLTPISTVSIHGILQIPHFVPVYQMSVQLPPINGVCQLAADSRLPNKTINRY